MKTARAFCFFGSVLLMASLPLHAEDSKPAAPKPPAPPPRRRPEKVVISPEVHPDHTVTFRLRAPAAQKVELSLAVPKDGNLPMAQGTDGVWSVTTAALEPEIYEYSLVVDGVRMTDPGNVHIKPGRQTNSSIVFIQGNPPLLHDWQNVPHGAVTIHAYASKALHKVRRVVVYTPPGYSKDTGTKYPTLYLFHGSGDIESCWAELGRAPLILDNLIAQGKAKPMLIVMPNGHAVEQGESPVPTKNLEMFEKDLLGDVMPLVEDNYRVVPDAAHRAIIGLSMGGGQSLVIGMNHPDMFAWIGGMSGYVPDAEHTVGASVTAPGFGDKVKLLWFAIGKQDFLLDQNKALDAFLTSKNVKHEFVLTEGAHRWPVWRGYLADFAPLIFK
jgi:enterochelin esterase family protein